MLISLAEKQRIVDSVVDSRIADGQLKSENRDIYVAFMMTSINFYEVGFLAGIAYAASLQSETVPTEHLTDAFRKGVKKDLPS